MRTCEKHTQYYILGLLSFLTGHMIDPLIHEILLPLWLRLISCSRGYRPSAALPCEMTSQPTLETSSTSTTSLSWGTMRGWSIRAETLLQVLAGWLLHARSRWLLLRPLHLEAQMLGMKVRSLRQELWVRHLHWHRWPVHLWWFEELVRLWEAGPNFAPRGLSTEWHLPLAILLHLLDLVFNNNGLVDHVLEVCIVCVEQLELDIIIQPIQELVLFLFISVNVIRGISW
jgi:hypothetical protein